MVHGKDEGGEIYYYPRPEDNLLILGQELFVLCYDSNIDIMKRSNFFAAEGELASLTCVAERFRPLPFIRYI